MGNIDNLNLDNFTFLMQISSRMRFGERFDDSLFIKKGWEYLLEYAKKASGEIDEGRRKFLKGLVIGISAAAIGGIIPKGIQYLTPPLPSLSSFPDLLLVDSNANPLLGSDTNTLPVNSPMITLFNYPLSEYPNFLIRLGDANDNEIAVGPSTVTIPENGSTYSFPGGVGPKNSIVAYSAICQHLGCTPPQIHFYPPAYVNESMLSAPTPNALTPEALSAAKQSNAPSIIHCDCHGSTYNPYKGAEVLTTPTQRPLPAVELYWDQSTDYIYAKGMIGVPIYGAPNGNDLEGIALSTMNQNTLEGSTPVQETINTFT